MAKQATKQSSSKAAPKRASKAGPNASEAAGSSLISSIYARRYGTTSADAGVGVTPPTASPKGRAARK